MNIDNLPNVGNAGSHQLSRAVASAINAAETEYNWGSKERAIKLREFFQYCTDFLDETIIKEKKTKKEKNKDEAQ